MKRNSPIRNLSTAEFEGFALDIFRYQSRSNRVYGDFIKHLGINTKAISLLQEIPFLPIQFFKSHKVISGQKPVQRLFESSGTTGKEVSRHFITDLTVYEHSFIEGFKHFYGPVEDFTILALLPAYLERSGSSLVYMTHELIKRSQKKYSGFYLHNLGDLNEVLLQLDAANEKVLLLGVSYALLDLVERYQYNLKSTIIMETGGMKGRRKELIREDLHKRLCKGFGVKTIHSEYGMTELLSQAYSKGNGLFACPPWMRILIRDTEDAMALLPAGRSGGINVIDLANLNSCSFIATQDLGRITQEGSFEVLGRFDHSDIRGCNLMVV